MLLICNSIDANPHLLLIIFDIAFYRFTSGNKTFLVLVNQAQKNAVGENRIRKINLNPLFISWFGVAI